MWRYWSDKDSPRCQAWASCAFFFFLALCQGKKRVPLAPPQISSPKQMTAQRSQSPAVVLTAPRSPFLLLFDDSAARSQLSFQLLVQATGVWCDAPASCCCPAAHTSSAAGDACRTAHRAYDEESLRASPPGHPSCFYLSGSGGDRRAGRCESATDAPTVPGPAEEACAAH